MRYMIWLETGYTMMCNNLREVKSYLTGVNVTWCVRDFETDEYLDRFYEKGVFDFMEGGPQLLKRFKKSRTQV